MAKSDKQRFKEQEAYLKKANAELDKQNKKWQEVAKSAALSNAELMASIGHLDKRTNVYKSNVSWAKQLSDSIGNSTSATDRLTQLTQTWDSVLEDAAKKGVIINDVMKEWFISQKKILEDAKKIEEAEDEISQLQTARKQALKDIGEQAEFLGTSFKEYSDMVKDPKTAGLVMATALIKEFGALGSAIRDNNKQLGLMGEQSRHAAGQITETTAKMRMMGVDAQESGAAFQALRGNTALNETCFSCIRLGDT